MTLGELYRATAALGFDDNLDDDDVFRMAADRAIVEANAICPRIGTYILHHDPPKNEISRAGFSPIGKDSDLYFASCGVKAFTFEADGNGKAYIEAFDGVAWQVIKEIDLSSDGSFKRYCGLIKCDGEFFTGDVRLHFTGDYYYSIRCVALYRTVRSAVDADVPPYSPMIRYDMKGLAEGFMALCKPPITEDEEIRSAEGYEVEERRYLLMPREKKGVFRIRYEILPPKISEDEETEGSETEIPLPEEVCSILPLLVAAYVWAEDEEERAAVYHSIYRERAAELMKKYREMSPVRVRSVKGW